MCDVDRLLHVTVGGFPLQLIDRVFSRDSDLASDVHFESYASKIQCMRDEDWLSAFHKPRILTPFLVSHSKLHQRVVCIVLCTFSATVLSFFMRNVSCLKQALKWLTTASSTHTSIHWYHHCICTLTYRLLFISCYRLFETTTKSTNIYGMVVMVHQSKSA